MLSLSSFFIRRRFNILKERDVYASMLHPIYFALLTNLGTRTYAYKFTVLAEYVLETHQRLKNDLEFHIEEEEKRLAILKIYLNIFEREHRKAMEDASYVGNPINAFTLIKRLTSDVHYIKTHIKNGAEYAQNFTRYYDAKYPSLEHLSSAAAVIAGFHHTSDLDVKQLVDGNLTNRTYSYLDLYIREHKKAMEDSSSYLCNPVNGFILIKRLVVDLDHLPTIIKTGAEQLSHLLVKQDILYPDIGDLIGAAQAIARLQKTYNLDVKNLASGNLNNIAYTTRMTAGDCFELGHALIFKSKDYKAGRSWMIEAHRKYSEENVSYPFTEAEIIKYISIAKAMSGETKKALPSPSINDSRAEENVHPLHMHFKQEELPEHEINQAELENYEALCRGDIIVPTKISKRLKCSYLTKNHPFLILAPYKIEMMYVDPDIVLFHDVLSDSEIETIKQMAKPKLMRAKINHPKTGYLNSANYRISKIAWLFDKDSNILDRITRRVAHMTGLFTNGTNESQVVNYGIGGHYEPHHDFLRKEDMYELQPNIIATILFYMTDVAQGGATVFPELGVRLRPVKGAAAFWYNLHPSGNGNLAMRHAACPVLQGEKWAFSKFIMHPPQLFTRPCNLEYQEQGFIKKIPRPAPKTDR